MSDLQDLSTQMEFEKIQPAVNVKQKLGSEVQLVKITGIDIPLQNLFVLLIKLAIASIPAVIVLSILWFLGIAFGGVFFSALMSEMAK